ncbi:hypothetical protein PMAYCL1PPCAC_19738 [Pristionchus mayeri]|uniref:F-box domain-containing protein n=1 Tax=Pristionchus mayeri TaxID=1317129 RepID=A0AAN5I2I7_9BILA|nr:hypothetical protein PMAYCL1PPCAC_19738 [Pristionchus mayeri]
MASFSAIGEVSHVFECLSLDNLSPFELLPRDLLWIILDYVPESILSLRPTSQICKSRVDAYALSCRDSPLVKLLEISESYHVPPRTIYVVMHVDKKISGLFELRLRLKKTVFDVVAKIERFQMPLNPHWTYRLCFHYAYDEYRVLDYVKDCVGKRIEETKIALGDEPLVTACTLVLGQVHCPKLAVNGYLTDITKNHLLKIIAEQNVDHLELNISGKTIPDTVEMLLQLPSLVYSIAICWIYPHDMSSVQTWLDSAKDINWAETIAEVFSRKVDKLKINGLSSPVRLNHRDSIMLGERLPMLGKRIWLEAPIRASPVDYENNEHAIQIKAIPRERMRGHYADTSSYKLSIKHSTRMHETFDAFKKLPLGRS